MHNAWQDVSVLTITFNDLVYPIFPIKAAQRSVNTIHQKFHHKKPMDTFYPHVTWHF